MKKAKLHKLTQVDFGNILGLHEDAFGQFESSSPADQFPVVMARIVERHDELNGCRSQDPAELTLWLYFSAVIDDAAEVVTPDGTVYSVPPELADLAKWCISNNLSQYDDYY